LDRAGIKIDKYYASEIDEFAITISKNNYPGIVRWEMLMVGENGILIGQELIYLLVAARAKDLVMLGRC
jgi:hypothetical protein